MALRRIPHARFAVGQDGLARAQSTDPVPVEPRPGVAVHVVLERGTRTSEATIEAMGRKWVTLAVGARTYRFARPASAPWPNKLPLDGGDHRSPGEVVFDMDAERSERALATAWLELRAVVRDTHRAPAAVTLESIAAARKALGL